MKTTQIDMLELTRQDVALVRVAGTDGGEFAGPCPSCGGRDRFRVWPNKSGGGRYWCRQCGKQGDLIQYLRDFHGMTFAGACEALGVGGDLPRAKARPPEPKHGPLAAPGAIWQARGLAFCADSEQNLRGPEGARALAWLRDVRGLTDKTIKEAGLGYNPADRHEDRQSWGLSPGNPVWLPRGIVIPWRIGGDLWRVNIRRPAGDPKYIGPAGAGIGLYNADWLASGWPAVLVEGELDALTLCQFAGGLASPVATGSTGGGRRSRWLAKLAVCSRVLVAFDADKGGENAAAYWLGVLENARRWRPYFGHDANGMAQAGGDVRAWIEAGLAAHA